MAVDYMRFAQLAGAQNPMGEGLASLGQTLQQNEALKRQKMLDQRQMRLSDLQMQQQEAQMADQQAQQGAKQQLYGATDPQETYLKQAQAQQQADLHKKDMEVEKQILDLVGKGKERGLKAEQLNPIIQAWSADIQNPKKKEMYQNLKLNDNWGSTTKIMLDGSEGINHPITGRPLTAGIYQIEFDQNRKPVKVDFVQEMKPDSEALLDKRLAAQAAAQERSIAAADARTAKQIAAADARASQTGNKTDPMLAREAIKDLPKLRKEANMASASKERVSQMINLYDKGAAAGLKGNVLSAISGIFDIPATSEADLFKKLASAGAGQLRSTVIGPGQVSNYEQKLLQSVSGGGSGARTAVRELLLFYQQEADRTINNYNDAVESAGTIVPNATKVFRPIAGAKNKNAPKTSGGLKPDGKGGFIWQP